MTKTGPASGPPPGPSGPSGPPSGPSGSPSGHGEAGLHGQAAAAFRALADRLCDALEGAEAEAALPPEGEGSPARSPRARFSREDWRREDLPPVAPPPNPPSGARAAPPPAPEMEGGGRSALLEGGAVLEKAAVNYSDVHGVFSERFAGQIPGTEASRAFAATGVSIIAHPRSPHLPTAHLNIRHIQTGRGWFGGGADITPMGPLPRSAWGADPALTRFHMAMKSVCAAHPEAADYPRFRDWCEHYFWLPHRGETRGDGGIFWDYMGASEGSEVALQKDDDGLKFCLALGKIFAAVYGAILREGAARPWNESDRAAQLRRRGRYAEFNLLYDRGTRFGLETGGNPTTILSSLPPLAGW